MANLNNVFLVVDDELESLFTTALSTQTSAQEISMTNRISGILKEIEEKKELEQQQQHNPTEKIYPNLMKTVNAFWPKPKPKNTQEHKLATPKAYAFKQIYDKNKQILLKQQEANERKLREFHARPMPNFSLAHQLIKNKQHTPRVTPCPVTPNVLKTSVQAETKRKELMNQLAKQKELELKIILKNNFKAQAVPKYNFSIYNLEPLKPSNRPFSLNTQPFNLKSELRGQQRKLFDEQNKKILEEKNRLKEQEHKKREVELNQRQRLLTTFKARVNPFASHLK